MNSSMASTSKNHQKPVKHACQSCDKPDNMDMVQCDICDKWFHFNCVGVTQEISGYEWSCQECEPNNRTKDIKIYNDVSENKFSSAIRTGST